MLYVSVHNETILTYMLFLWSSNRSVWNGVPSMNILIWPWSCRKSAIFNLKRRDQSRYLPFVRIMHSLGRCFLIVLNWQCHRMYFYAFQWHYRYVCLCLVQSEWVLHRNERYLMRDCNLLRSDLPWLAEKISATTYVS